MTTNAKEIETEEKKKKKVARVTKKEKEERIAVVADLLAENKRSLEICQIVSAKWGISERTGRRYIKKANEFFKESADIDKEKARGKMLKQLDSLYVDAISDDNPEKKDIKTAVLILRETSELLGLKKIPPLVGDFTAIIKTQWGNGGNSEEERDKS